MGKIKGWTKQKQDRYYGKTWWMYKDNIATVSVSSKQHGDYNVFTPTIHKKFITRKEAVDYAMAYMRRYNG